MVLVQTSFWVLWNEIKSAKKLQWQIGCAKAIHKTTLQTVDLSVAILGCFYVHPGTALKQRRRDWHFNAMSLFAYLRRTDVLTAAKNTSCRRFGASVHLKRVVANTVGLFSLPEGKNLERAERGMLWCHIPLHLAWFTFKQKAFLFFTRDIVTTSTMAWIQSWARYQ